jgi:putative ABC transport system permease protein
VQQGRSLTDADNASAQPVAIVNEAFAKRFFDNQNPLAQQLSVGRGTNDPVRQVVGVVADTKQQGLDSPVPPMVFVPVPQMPDKLLAIVRTFTSANFTIRTTVAPLSLREAVKHEIAQLDPTLSLSDFASMEEVTARSIAPQRFNMLLVGLFAGLGLLLAAVGIYGVISYVVTQRTNEIGLRIALGAQATDVIRLILGRGLALAFSGVVLGIVAAFILTRLMKNFLYSVSATDPVTFVFISLLLVGVALLACYLPARRAAKTDPMVALRYE